MLQAGSATRSERATRDFIQADLGNPRGGRRDWKSLFQQHLPPFPVALRLGSACPASEGTREEGGGGRH